MFVVEPVARLFVSGDFPSSFLFNATETLTHLNYTGISDQRAGSDLQRQESRLVPHTDFCQDLIAIQSYHKERNLLHRLYEAQI